MNYSVKQIAKILGVKNSGLHDCRISILLTDSRQLFRARETLFFALETRTNDAHKFIGELYECGVRNFVVSQMQAEWGKYCDANFLQVKNTLNALQKIVASHRKQFDIPVIGITGSNGKTVVKEWLYQVLNPDYNIAHSPRSYNSQIGVPLSVWQMNEKTELGIFEAGISKPEEMSRVEAVIHPSIGIFTNIGQAHQEGFESLRQKCLEKLDLFIHCDIIICEEENRLLEECMQAACLSQKRMTWSRSGAPRSPIQIRKIEKLTSFTLIHLSVLEYDTQIQIPFTDNASIENAMQIIATAVYLRVPIDEIAKRMMKIEPVAMRLDVRQGKNQNILINDSYNSDINSLTIALDFMQQRAAHNSLKKVLILSDIPQSGLDHKELYEEAATLVKEKKVDELIGIGEDILGNKSAFQFTENSFYKSTEDFIKSAKWQSFQNAVILLKGARDFQFEQINKVLEMKSHETLLDVNLDAIVHNFKFYRSRLEPSTKLVCMVKADGYGSGACEVAKTLQYHKCDYMAVAIAEEGIILRKSGITTPIIVLNPEVGGFEELLAYRLEPEVYNFRILKAYIKEAKQAGIIDYPIHLKVDTGMHRLGITKEDIPELIGLLRSQNAIRLQSVFSHLAASESWNFDDFTTAQIKTFKDIANEIQSAFDYHIMKHILNSAGIERFPDEQMDMVRLGISLYGVSASGLEGLRNVCTLKTTVLQIKNIGRGETVGYGRKGKVEKDSKIATIRIGYADGVDRRMGNGIGKVYVNGKFAPLVGNICMDLSMIDVTDIDVKEGDSVIIFGQENPIVDVAQCIGTIPYEVLTSVSQRVKHIYYRE